MTDLPADDLMDDLLLQSRRTAQLNAHYERLAFELNDGDKGRFLSGWQCENPFVGDFLARVRRRSAKLDHVGYSYFDDEPLLVAAISALHEALDGRAPPHVFCGSGSTSLLFGIANYLRFLGIQEVYCLPPIYFTLQIALDRFGIRVTSAALGQPFEPAFALALPDRPGTTLILTDPVWYAGAPIPKDVLSQVAAWQIANDATIIVDGSLQYLAWDGSRCELTAALDPRRTIRVICPSKQLSIHGYRFAYAIVPQEHRQAFAWTYTNMLGPANVDSIAFAYEAIEALTTGQIPRLLMQRAAGTHARLRSTGAIASPFDPTCGYFVFERVNAALPDHYLTIDGRYFEQARYPGHVKINLLSPSIGLIDIDP